MIYELMGAVHARVPQVDIPKPGTPDSKDIVDKLSDGGHWLTLRSPSFWLIIVCLALTFLVAKALKKPMVKGIAIGVILLAIALAVFNN